MTGTSFGVLITISVLTLKHLFCAPGREWSWVVRQHCWCLITFFFLHFSAKFPPPDLDPVELHSSEVTVKWSNPAWLESLSVQFLICALQYKTSRDHDWTYVSLYYLSPFLLPASKLGLGEENSWCWMLPSLPRSFALYCSSFLSQVNVDSANEDSYDLEDLKPFTSYEVQVRCIPHQKGFWSEWSSSQIFVTPEAGKCYLGGSRTYPD